MRLWGPRGADEAIIAEEEEERDESEAESRSLEEIAQSNQGSMDAGEFLASCPYRHRIVFLYSRYVPRYVPWLGEQESTAWASLPVGASGCHLILPPWRVLSLPLAKLTS